MFIINKKLKEVKTPRADIKGLSPVASLLWDFIEGVMKAFTTEFERSKLTREMEKMQGKLDTSAARLAGLRAEEEAKKNKIKEQNLEYERKTKECEKKEKETAELMKLLEHEQTFVDTSSFFAAHCAVQKEELQVDEREALQEAIIQVNFDFNLRECFPKKAAVLLDFVQITPPPSSPNLDNLF